MSYFFFVILVFLLLCFCMFEINVWQHISPNVSLHTLMVCAELRWLFSESWSRRDSRATEVEVIWGTCRCLSNGPLHSSSALSASYLTLMVNDLQWRRGSVAGLEIESHRNIRSVIVKLVDTEPFAASAAGTISFNCFLQTKMMFRSGHFVCHTGTQRY